MESCMMKPEVKKKPQPPKPPPKTAEIKRNPPERPTPLVPPRPTDTATENLKQRETKATPSKTPVVPPRPTEKELKGTTRYSQHRRAEAGDAQSSREDDASEAPKANAEVKESAKTAWTGIFQRSQKEKTPSFTSYVIDDSDKEIKTDDLPAKLVPDGKQQASREPSPNLCAEEVGPEKEQFTEQTKNKEAKRDKGSLIAGMFWKTNKEKSSSPAQKVRKVENDPEETEEKISEESHEKGGLFSGILKKSQKTTDDETPAQDNLSSCELSASNDSLSDNNGNKEKGGIFGGIFKKPPKLSEAANTDEPQQSINDKLSGSSDNLFENSKQEKGGFFTGILGKSPKVPREGTAGQDKKLLPTKLSDNTEAESENNATKEKGNIFSGMFKKSPKLSEAPRLEEGTQSLHSELSASIDSLSENKEKGKLFGGLLRKTPKTTTEENLLAQKDLSGSNDSLSESANTREKGGFSGIFKKSLKHADSPPPEEKQSQDDELSSKNEAPVENNTKEKGQKFGRIFKKTPKPAEATQPDEDESPDDKLLTSTENSSENKLEKGGGLFSGLLKKIPKASGERTDSPDKEAQKELATGNNDFCESNTTKEKSVLSNIFKKPQKLAEDAVPSKDVEVNSVKELSGSSENLSDVPGPKEKKGLAGIFKRSTSIDNLLDEEKGGLFSGLIKKTPKPSGDEGAAEDKDDQKELTASNDSLSENSNTKEKSIFSGMFKRTNKPAEGAPAHEESNMEDNKLSASYENLSEATTSKERSGGLGGIFKKSPKPAPRTIVTEDPLSGSKELSSSCDSLVENAEEDFQELSASNENLCEAANTTKEKKGGFGGLFRRTPKNVERQESEDMEASEPAGLRRRRTIKKKKRVVSFRVKKTHLKTPKSDQSSEKMPIIEESVQLQELNCVEESSVEVEPVEMASYPTEDNSAEAEEESDELMEWWNTVKGWTEWNDTSNLEDMDEETALEQAADRVYMAARLFVRLFNQRGASLQHRILELLALADAADHFHKKTVTAAVGGGVASVAGSVATITGLILAPFTFGASIIVTAVGISVATAGSIASATANITDTVHSNMDRKKLEKMIQGYQDEIKVIRECMEFVQAGMDTLQEWDFEKYSQSAAKKALNHNLKHVMKEGGRAGKALMINTDKLISTVQILGAAGGAAKAAQAISVTTGVMSALFLALDVFFLAKDSHELRKGAKTKFATKIRDVCKDLQDGLLELNKVKTQLQKTMDGIEVEEYEEIKEVEVEVEVEDDFESDPKKLAELEQELDLLEEKLDRKSEEEQQKSKELEKDGLKDKVKSEEKSMKEKGEPKDKEKEVEKERKKETKKEKVEKEKQPKSEVADEEKEQKNECIKESQKGRKHDKETENQTTAAKEKHESKKDTAKEDRGPKQTDIKEKEKNKIEKEPAELTCRSGESKGEERSGKAQSAKVRKERDSERSKSGREDEQWMTKDAEHGSTRRHSSRSNKERPDKGDRGSKHEIREPERERGSSKQSDSMESWRRRDDVERGVREGRQRKEAQESNRQTSDMRKESHQSHQTSHRREHSERELGRVESNSSHSQKGAAFHDEQRERRKEKPGSRIESMRRQFERLGTEEGEGEGESQRRDRDRDRDRERGHRGSRSSVLLEDGLYI